MRTNISVFSWFLSAQMIFMVSCNFLGSDQIADQELPGEWEWEMSSGGIAGLVLFRFS
ncbi:MAG: hypothetical protein WEA56_05025 [Balneolaceae bacterium]